MKSDSTAQRRKYDALGPVQAPDLWQELHDRGLPPPGDKNAWYRLVHELVGYEDVASFALRVGRALEQAQHQASPIALILFELRSNRGPLISHALATVLADQAKRDADRVCALEGNLFAMILPATDEDGALVVAQRVIRSFRERLAGRAGPDTVLAAGLACVAGHARTEGAALVEQAERAIYVAAECHQDCIYDSQGPISIEGEVLIDLPELA